MRELSFEELRIVSGGGSDGSIHLGTISISSDRASGSNRTGFGGGNAGNEAKFGKKIDQGTYQKGDIITRINRDSSGNISYQVYNKNKSIYNGSDEKTLLQKLTAEFGFRFGSSNHRANEPR